MISFLAQGFVIAGALILIVALFPVRRLIGQLPLGPVRSRWYGMTVLIVLFLIGYMGYAGVSWNSHQSLLDLIVPGVFFFGGCFVWLTANLSLQTTLDIMRMSMLERENVTDPLTGVFNRRFSEEVNSVEKLIHAADTNLYRAKQEGRSRVCSDTPGTLAP